MRIYKEDGIKTIDFDGTIIFHKNDVGIRIDDVKESDMHDLTIKNALLVGQFKGGFIARVRNCIRLYKFLKA